MKKAWKKGLSVVGATVLAASLPLYTEAASNITVKGKVFPKAGISLNFDNVDFNGTLGAPATSVYKLGNAAVTTPQINVRYKDNYNVGVKSSTFTGTDASNNTINLDTTRISVQSDQTAKLSSTAQNIISGTGDGTTSQAATKPFNITLDLAETGYTDTISNLASDLNLNATITVSFNGL
ncbi:hypothetical protein ACFW35_02975 [Fictibacillus sp. NPDC058756]|uniref:hypothetical protein n=1 Tax=Fictibacillus sp. NPDC058756 TaxID=3346625 RepID=UPI0036877697